MENIGKSRFVWVRFRKDGSADPSARKALADAMKASAAKHVVVISHGWKNSEDDAAALYRNLWTSTAASLRRIDPAEVLVVGVQWPARRYEPTVDAAILRSASKGGVLLFTREETEELDLDEGRFRTVVSLFKQTLDQEQAEVLQDRIDDYLDREDDEAADDLLKIVSEVSELADVSDDELLADRSILLDIVAEAPSSLRILAAPHYLEMADGSGTTQGLRDRIGAMFEGPRSGIVRLLEQFSYFEMKKRAGSVGASLGALLTEARSNGTTLHLVGHSFGGRVVTAAAGSFKPNGGHGPSSLILLQAAFSHNGFSKARGGAFHLVPPKVEGPISITHTFNDNACTAIYALASRFSQDKVERLGDKNDVFGSMGANGAQFDENETAALEEASGNFRPKPGKITNYLADDYIADHGDVKNATVGKLVAASIEAL